MMHMDATSEILQTLQKDDKEWIESLLSITSKSGGVVDFKLSNFQEYYLNQRATGRNRRVILKPRQILASTIILAKNFKKAVTEPGTRVLELTHHAEATELFRMTVKSWCTQLDSFGLLPVVENDSASLLSFKNTGSFMVFQTAGGRFGGRSTSFNTVHLSEVAHWPGDPYTILGGILPSVPTEGEVDMESTPRGADGPFHDYYTDAKAGEIDWDYIFWPWFNNPEYSRDLVKRLLLSPKEQLIQAQYSLSEEQMSWRQWMEAELKRTAQNSESGLFAQEYPEDDISCFLAGLDSVLDSEVLQEFISFLQPPLIRHEEWDIWKGVMPDTPYVIGVDSSEGKSDYSAASIINANTMEMVARYHAKTIPSHFAEVLETGGRMYGDALVTVETPGPGGRVIDHLLGRNYPNLYYYRDETTGRDSDEPGWPQNVKTRNIMIDNLQTMTSARNYRIYDERTLRELASLTWRKVGSMKRARAEAAPGSKDDLVFSLGLGLSTAFDAVQSWRRKRGKDGRRAIPIDQGYPEYPDGTKIVALRYM